MMHTVNKIDSSAPGGMTVRDAGAWRGAAVLTALAMAVFGFGYSMAGVGLGQALFQTQADGSLIEHDGRVLGSGLVAQPFVGERYFHSRPSAAGYDPMAVSGSNLARSNPALRERLAQARDEAARREGVDPARLPSDLLTQSGGGIDPHLSPESALVQVERVARWRGIAPASVAEEVARHTEPPQWGWLGAPRVNVLALNLALDARPSR